MNRVDDLFDCARYVYGRDDLALAARMVQDAPAALVMEAIAECDFPVPLRFPLLLAWACPEPTASPADVRRRSAALAVAKLDRPVHRDTWMYEGTLPTTGDPGERARALDRLIRAEVAILQGGV